jgi:predicted branched-subunit amino acid permease
MSAAMFAGASQFVAAEIWTEPLTLTAIATLVLVTATVNMRFVLMAASLHPWLGGLPAWRTYPALARSLPWSPLAR